MENKQALEFKTLSETLKTYDKVIIQQQNENIFLLNNKNQDKIRITQLKDELIKVLKQFIKNQNCNQFNMIELAIMLGFKSKFNPTILEGLRFQKDQEYLEEYINLLLSLQNKQEEFITQIKNPFNNRENNSIEMYVEKMKIKNDDNQMCWECEDKKKSIKSFEVNESTNQLKEYGLNKIQIDNINVSFVKDRCKHMKKEIEIDKKININLSGIHCNNLEISYLDFEYVLFLDINLQIENPLKLLKIFVEQDEDVELADFEFSFNVDFLNESAYISKLEIIIPKHFENNTYGGEYYDKRAIFKQAFKYDKISEYELNFSKGYDQLFKSLSKVDRECDKIIFYTNYNKKSAFFNKFVQLRNNVNSFKYQLIAFDKIISPFLKYSPTFTFLDLHEDILKK